MAISQSASNERMWTAEKTSMNLEFLSSLTPHQLPNHLQTFRLSSRRCDLWIFLPTDIYQTFQTYMLSFPEISNFLTLISASQFLGLSIKIDFCHLHLTHTSPTQLPWPNLPPSPWAHEPHASQQVSFLPVVPGVSRTVRLLPHNLPKEAKSKYHWNANTLRVFEGVKESR